MTASDLQGALVAEAALAPSVHNVQPARWRLDGDAVILFEDCSRRLAVGDPHGRDAAISLGAAAEGMAIALSRHGLAMRDAGGTDLAPPSADVVPVRRFSIAAGADPDPLAEAVPLRQSYRGAFLRATDEDRRRAATLASDDVAVVAEPEALTRLARRVDASGLAFFRDSAFRKEIVSWMRFSPRDPRWTRDGLNAAAMAMSRLEAAGAKRVLGRLFPLLDRIGLAAPLTSDAAKVKSAAAVLVLHRPADEDPFATGRAFYRAWLEVTAAGFQAAVMASLADHEGIAAETARELGLAPDHRIVSALRIGRVPPGAAYPRARLPVDELMV